MRTITLLLACALLVVAGCDDGGSSPGGDDGDSTPRTGPGEDAGMGADAAPEPVTVALDITSPEEGAVLATRRVTIGGTVTPAGTAVQVDGQAATVNGTAFEAQVELEAGTHTITATAGDATDTVTVTVDPIPPRIDITAPARGTWTEAGQVDLAFTVTDESGLASVTRNDLSVDPGLGPNFQLSGVPLSPGLNLMLLEATDAAGNSAREHVAILSGATRDPGAVLPGAARLHIGNAGIDAIERLALRVLEEQDLAALVPVDSLPDLGPFVIAVDEITYRRPATLELTPEPERLAFRMRLEALAIQLGLRVNQRPLVPAFIGNSFVEISGYIIPSIVDGQVRIALEDIDAAFGDFEFQLREVPEFEENPQAGETFLAELATAVVEVFAAELVTGLIDQALGGLDTSFDLELLGAQLTLALIPSRIVVSQRGISVVIDGRVDLANPAPGAPAVPGYVTTPSNWTGAPQTDQIGIAVDDDFFNLFLYQIWRSGVLLPTLDQASLTDAGSQLRVITSLLGTTLGQVYPDVSPRTPLRVDTELPLPIVVAVRKAGDGIGLEVGIGDLDVQVDTDEAEPRRLLEGSASIRLLGDLAVVTQPAEEGDGEVLALKFTSRDTLTAFDVTNESLRGAVENSVEQPMNTLLQAAGDVVPGLLSGIPIPSLDFVSFAEIRIDAGQADPNFIEIIATLAE